MKEERLEHFRKMTDEQKYALTYQDFTVSEIKELIAETPMCDLDKRIAVGKFVNDMTADEIGDKEHLDVRTVARHILKIRCLIKCTCIKYLV